MKELRKRIKNVREKEKTFKEGENIEKTNNMKERKDGRDAWSHGTMANG